MARAYPHHSGELIPGLGRQCLGFDQGHRVPKTFGEENQVGTGPGAGPGLWGLWGGGEFGSLKVDTCHGEQIQAVSSCWALGTVEVSRLLQRLAAFDHTSWTDFGFCCQELSDAVRMRKMEVIAAATKSACDAGAHAPCRAEVVPTVCWKSVGMVCEHAGREQHIQSASSHMNAF